MSSVASMFDLDVLLKETSIVAQRVRRQGRPTMGRGDGQGLPSSTMLRQPADSQTRRLVVARVVMISGRGAAACSMMLSLALACFGDLGMRRRRSGKSTQYRWTNYRNPHSQLLFWHDDHEQGIRSYRPYRVPWI